MNELDNSGGTAKSKSKKRWLLLGLIFLAILSALSISVLQLTHKQASPKELSDVRKTVSFPVYYPSSLPNGYIFKNGSVAAQNGVLFYKLQNGSQTVSISEQAMPDPPPDIKNSQANNNVKQINIADGRALVGLYKQTPVAIALTKTTLINLNTSGGVTNDALTSIVQNLSRE